MIITIRFLLLVLAPILVFAAGNVTYLGCLLVPSAGISRPLAFNAINFQRIPASPARCASECQFANGGPAGGFNYNYPMFALDNYSCFCGFHLAPGAKLGLNRICDTKCSGDASATCGGDKAVSLYGDGQFLSTPIYVDGLNFDKCYEFDESKHNGPKYVDATNMTVNSCANFCVEHGKYGISLDKDDNCYCTDAAQDMGKFSRDVDYSCNHPCSGDKKQSCGGGDSRQKYVSHWKFNQTA